MRDGRSKDHANITDPNTNSLADAYSHTYTYTYTYTYTGSSPFRVGRGATAGSSGIGRSANRVASMDAGH